MRTIRRWLAVVAVGLGLVAGAVVAPPPAGADPTDIYLPAWVSSPMYMVNGCRYKALYGDYLGASAASIRLYDPVACDGATVAVKTRSPSGVVRYTWFTNSQGPNTDACGPFVAKFAHGPAGDAAIGMVTVVPESPAPPAFDGWRIYAGDGLQTQPIHATC